MSGTFLHCTNKYIFCGNWNWEKEILPGMINKIRNWKVFVLFVGVLEKVGINLVIHISRLLEAPILKLTLAICSKLIEKAVF